MRIFRLTEKLIFGERVCEGGGHVRHHYRLKPQNPASTPTSAKTMPAVTRSKRKRLQAKTRRKGECGDPSDTNASAYQSAKSAWRQRLNQMLQGSCGSSLASEDSSKCKTCNSSDNITFYSIQTRSSDEASTIFLVCGACKSRWRL